jgi:D-xylose transport system permease protein
LAVRAFSGGRGSTYSALLGILVIQSITNGMLLLNVDSSVRFIVTGSDGKICGAATTQWRNAAPPAPRWGPSKVSRS